MRVDVCLADCAIHKILRDKRCFLDLTLPNVNVSTISGTTNLIGGYKIANIMLPNGTKFYINDVLYCIKFTRILISFKDIHGN